MAEIIVIESKKANGELAWFAGWTAPWTADLSRARTFETFLAAETIRVSLHPDTETESIYAARREV